MHSTSLRLSATQARIIMVGLRRPYTNGTNYQMTGNLTDCHPSLITNRNAPGFGTYYKSQMDLTMYLFRRVRAGGKSGVRLKLDYFGVSALLFAARNCQREIDHGHQQSWRRRLKRSIGELIRKLELAQKRLKRLLVIDYGRAEFARMSDAWRQFIRWVRTHLAFCKCMWRIPHPAYRLRKVRMNEFENWTRAELTSRGIDHDDVPVRALIGKCVRTVRRTMKPYHLSDLVQNPSLAGSFFASYVEQHLIRSSK